MHSVTSNAVAIALNVYKMKNLIIFTRKNTNTYILDIPVHCICKLYTERNNGAYGEYSFTYSQFVKNVEIINMTISLVQNGRFRITTTNIYSVLLFSFIISPETGTGIAVYEEE